jgi:hypothetical protein
MLTVVASLVCCHLFVAQGGFVLGEIQRLRGIDAIQEVDECTAQRFESDSQPSLHAVVVTDDQPRECVCRFPSAVGFDGHFHARKDSDVENFTHSDLQSTFVAEGARKHRHGSVS